VRVRPGRIAFSTRWGSDVRGVDLFWSQVAQHVLIFQGLCFVTMIPYLFFLLAALSISFILGLIVLWNWAIVMLY
jgi:hypothetical protein